MANSAMKNCAELSSIIHFMKRLKPCIDFESIGNLVVETAQYYALDAVMFIKSQHLQFFIGSHEEVDSADENMIQKLRSTEHFRVCGNVCLFNMPHSTLLVKNMPIKDKKDMARLRDYLQTMMHEADAKIVSLFELDEDETPPEDDRVLDGDVYI